MARKASARSKRTSARRRSALRQIESVVKDYLDRRLDSRRLRAQQEFIRQQAASDRESLLAQAARGRVAGPGGGPGQASVGLEKRQDDVEVRDREDQPCRCRWDFDITDQNDDPIEQDGVLADVVLSADGPVVAGFSRAIGSLFVDAFASTNVAGSLAALRRIDILKIADPGCDCTGTIEISGRVLIRAFASTDNSDPFNSNTVAQASGVMQLSGPLDLVTAGAVVSGVDVSDDLEVTVGPFKVKPSKKADGDVRESFAMSGEASVQDRARILISTTVNLKSTVEGDFVAAKAAVLAEPDLEIVARCACARGGSGDTRVLVIGRDADERMRKLLEREGRRRTGQ